MILPQMTNDEIRQYKLRHVIKAGDDGIPNIFMPDDHFVVGTTRQKPVVQEVLDLFYHDTDPWSKIPRWKIDSKTEFKKDGTAKRVECSDDEYAEGIANAKIRFAQNEQLVLYENIPQYVQDLIIESYKKTIPQKDRNVLMSYLMASKLKVLLADLGDF